VLDINICSLRKLTYCGNIVLSVIFDLNAELKILLFIGTLREVCVMIASEAFRGTVKHQLGITYDHNLMITPK
jgi:hypothetical protein